ncbi:3-methyl-2-oxobutanoate hydroxymethyltransferase [Terrilactibacillus sp. BCM23-1]|uniref:3-methyl-2-oxobutanoate hydroxymethyltransferase n=1 Tax=Terrilactibacillus tamarindi TaxID=2599694 RepID=A0A6N8CR24_9BACI|nr:3-methyl-2-oxobutanoate hydroxymethyltransferase [Terrilactibacillus tamarindi]MTT32622.1 3-methyl-2-oxobutanoate hydroxymethyltransferase [Terrilactibacillus tamarindi]
MKTITHFQKMKKNHEKIAMLTAYDYPSAKGAEEAGIDLILVGDSVGMVVHGYESTVDVTLDEMILHTKAVKRGAQNTFIVTDMPFLTYHGTVSDTIQTARKLIQSGGAHALKLEGSGDVFHMIKRLTGAGVAVMSHLGLTPQSVGAMGGYKVQGKNLESAEKLIQDAIAAEESGAFALVLECVPEPIGTLITEKLTIPVIGIGAGRYTDGQVLVYHDVLKYGTDRLTSFAKSYADLSKTSRDGILDYIREVKESVFPTSEHVFHLDDQVLHALKGGDSK